MKRLSGFICGVLVTVLIFSLTTVAFAALEAKNIQVHTGVELYIDDEEFTPKDVNGNEVEVLLYNGTTYLPVRAIGEAYGKEIYWDDSTKSVYIGKHEIPTTLADGKYQVYIDRYDIMTEVDGEKVKINFAEPVGLTQAEVDALIPGRSVIDFSDDIEYLSPITVKSVNYNTNKTEMYINNSDLTLYWSGQDQMWVVMDEAGAACYAETGDYDVLYVAEDAVIEDWSSSSKVVYDSMVDLASGNPYFTYNLVEITVKDNVITKVYVYYHP